MTALIKSAVVFLIIAVVLFLLWRSARKARLAPPTQVLGADRPRGAHAVAGRRAHRTAAGGRWPRSRATREAGDVNRFIDSQPDDVATMLRGWLADSPHVEQLVTTILTGSAEGGRRPGPARHRLGPPRSCGP